MANPEHLKVVRQGAQAIAEWGRKNPGVSLDLAGTTLGRADLAGADLYGANLAGADLFQANLARADLFSANLIRANLYRANLAGANLFKANFLGANLLGANLAGANLSRANLVGVNLVLADLSGAGLVGARMVGAYLSGANLAGADLTGVDLTGANLFGADLAGADLSEARLAATSLGNCDLSRATGLAAANHTAPSAIGVDTLIASFRGAGNQLTPELERFFRRAGVPGELLEALPRILPQVRYCSCFIAYAQPDLDFARWLRGELGAWGVACWLYALEGTPGEPTWPEMSRMRRQAERLIFLCSAKALVRDGVLKEIEEQIDEDPDKLIPISLDDLWKAPGLRVIRGKDLKPFLLERTHADFSNAAYYEEALQQLLKGLERR